VSTASTSQNPEGATSYCFGRALGFGAVSVLLGLTQGFGLNLVGSNLAAIQGSLGATAAEVSWLTSAYFTTALSASMLLAKARTQFGLRTFANAGLLFFLTVALFHLVTRDLVSAIAARAALGLAAAALSALAVLYMMEAFPKRLVIAGLLLGFATLQIGAPLSRVIVEYPLQWGQWHGLFAIDAGLAVLSMAAINAFPLAATPRQSAFATGDWVAFPLYSTAFALLCVAVTQGRLRWWTDTPWIGECLAASIACIGLYAVFELNRQKPMIDLHWLTRPFMLRFVIAVLLFRIILCEQTVGMVGLMNVLGLTNDQMHLLFLFATAGTVAGFFVALAVARFNRTNLLGVLAALLIAVVAWSDSSATALTRPVELYVTQTMLSVAASVYFATSCLIGFGRVIQEGGKNMVSFIAAFSGGQYLGTLLGTAWITTYVADRQQLHYAVLAQHLSLADPQVARRVTQLSEAIGHVIVDPAARSLQGVAQLAQQVTRESFVLAYNDVFQMTAVIAVAVMLWMIVLALRASSRSPEVAAAS
jgi:MFS family permease